MRRHTRRNTPPPSDSTRSLPACGVFAPDSGSRRPLPAGRRPEAFSRPRSLPGPLVRPRSGSRFRQPTPPLRPPAPPGEPGASGPSCFFPARAVEVLLAPATAAVLAFLGSGLANAATAPPAGTAVERGAQAVAGRTGVRSAEGPADAEGAQGAGGARDAEGEGGTGHPGTGTHDGRVGRPGEPARAEAAGHLGNPARAESSAEPSAGERSWPVAGPTGIRPTVLRGWDPPPSPWAAGHRGVDLASSAGSEVRAAAPGRVVYAGTVAGRGVLTLEVSRSGRPPLRTTYEPVRPTARKGQRVTAGQKVAVLQRGPFHCRAPCLHWGLRRGKTYLDPLSLLPRSMLRTGPSRLLPVFGVPVPTDGRTVPRHPEPPEPAAHAQSSTPTAAALLGTVGLAAAALWALGRLPSTRSASRGG
ncbi:murein hydrolase activator EnvC family protein [Streptomyces sioyaensis]|uniref:murein hydrolase activator EnvC family protein n=1 Tax=Streptomyces sioyaensis TaxID=67364 RepID=UPI0037A7E14E